MDEAFKKSKVRFYRAMGLFNAGIEASVGVMQVACIAAGGFLIMRGEMNYIDLITFTLYISAFTTPIRKMMQFMEIFTQGMAGLDRFLEKYLPNAGKSFLYRMLRHKNITLNGKKAEGSERLARGDALQVFFYGVMACCCIKRLNII